MKIKNPYSIPRSLKNHQSNNNEYYPFWENTLKMTAVASLLYLIIILTHMFISVYVDDNIMLWDYFGEEDTGLIPLTLIIYIYSLVHYFLIGFTSAKIEQSKRIRLSVWIVILIAILFNFLITIGVELLDELFSELYLGEENTMFEDAFSDIDNTIIDMLTFSGVAVLVHKIVFKNPYCELHTETDDLYFSGEEYPFWHNTLRMVIIPPLSSIIIITISMLFLTDIINDLGNIVSKGILAIIGAFFGFVFAFIVFYIFTIISNLPVGFIVTTFEKKYKIVLVSWFVFLIATIWNIIALISFEILASIVFNSYFNTEYEMFAYTSLELFYGMFTIIVYAIFAVLVHKYLFKNPFDDY